MGNTATLSGLRQLECDVGPIQQLYLKLSLCSAPYKSGCQGIGF